MAEPKPNDKFTDSSGQEWRRTQGGNWRNTATGKIGTPSSEFGATTPAAAPVGQTTPTMPNPQTTNPQDPAYSYQGDGNLDKAAFEALQKQTENEGRKITPEEWISVGGDWRQYHKLYGTQPLLTNPAGQNTIQQPGGGNPLNPTDLGLLQGAFGNEAGTAASNFEQLFRNAMPLMTVDTAPSLAEQDALANANRLVGQVDREFQPGIDAARIGMDNALIKDPNQQAALDYLANSAKNARNYDPRIEEGLARLKKLGEEGYNAQELTAMREGAFGGIDDELQTALREMSLNAGNRGIQGGAATIGQRSALQDSLAARRELERQLFEKNIGYKDQNYKDWLTGVGNLDAELFKREQDAGVNWFDSANQFQNDWLTNQQNATKTYGDIVSNHATAADTAGKTWWNAATGAANSVYNKNLFNIGQYEKYGSGILGAQTGGAGWQNAIEQQKIGNDLAQQQISAIGGGALEGGYSGGGEGDGGGGDAGGMEDEFDGGAKMIKPYSTGNSNYMIKPNNY